MKKFLSLKKFYTHAVTGVTDNYQVWSGPKQTPRFPVYEYLYDIPLFSVSKASIVQHSWPLPVTLPSSHWWELFWKFYWAVHFKRRNKVNSFIPPLPQNGCLYPSKNDIHQMYQFSKLTSSKWRSFLIQKIRLEIWTFKQSLCSLIHAAI